MNVVNGLAMTINESRPFAQSFAPEFRSRPDTPWRFVQHGEARRVTAAPISRGAIDVEASGNGAARAFRFKERRYLFSRRPRSRFFSTTASLWASSWAENTSVIRPCCASVRSRSNSSGCCRISDW